MTIGEVSQQYQISADTLRYYEKIGLLPMIPKKDGKRCYEEEHLNGVHIIEAAYDLQIGQREYMLEEI